MVKSPKVDYFHFENKVAIVVPGSRGIGRSVALKLASRGAKVVVASRNKRGDLDKVADELKGMGATFLAVPADMAKRGDISNLVEKTLLKFDTVDILFNGAASNPVMAPFTEIDERTWDRVMNVTLKGPFFLCQKVAREMMRKKRGVIVNLASIDGVRPAMDLTPYSAAKAGLIMLGQGMAKELGPYSIRVNTIAPGLVKTVASKGLWMNEERLLPRLKQTPLGRIGQADEIANTAIFLASEAASFITGITILVDGGRFVGMD